MDKIPVKTVPINETLDTNVDQCPDRYNVKRLKGKFALIGSDSESVSTLKIWWIMMNRIKFVNTERLSDDMEEKLHIPDNNIVPRCWDCITVHLELSKRF